jgi:hypothetical protein
LTTARGFFGSFKATMLRWTAVFFMTGFSFARTDPAAPRGVASSALTP